MPDQGLPPGTDVLAWLDRHRRKSLLRFITCGSVDDGKSTLIGRLLYDSRMILDDQMAALEADSRRVGTQGGALDFALLVDGLAAEREQGITIDVAYRFFATERRKFIVADTPGHEQYTRNMVTGASTADLAVLLIDARKGVLEQTRRHACLANLIGIRHVVLAVNKMDLVGWSREKFDAIVADFERFSTLLAPSSIVPIPISGLAGDNVAQASANTPWYRGPTLIEHLETVEVDAPASGTDRFRMPVQWVNRPDPGFRGFAGMVSSGEIRVGDPVRALPSGRTSSIARILLGDRDLEAAAAGSSITLTLADEIDVSRGDVLAASDDPPEVADQFEITLVWMAAEPMLPGRRYLVKLGARTVGGQITALKHRLNIETLEHVAAKSLALNEIARCNLSLESPVVFEPYERDRDLGGLILIDRETDATLAAGTIHFALRRAHNIHWQSIDVTRDTRAARKGQRPAVLWFTGLSGAGKSTIANLLDRRLSADGRHTVVLDGDNVRHGLNRDLGFSDADRVENIRRVAEVARLMADAGLIVIVSFISPFRSERELARSLMAPGEFFEIHVATDLATAEARDPKGLYAKARRGELARFTGIDSPYEPPEHPELAVDAGSLAPEEAVERILRMLATADRLGPPT